MLVNILLIASALLLFSSSVSGIVSGYNVAGDRAKLISSSVLSALAGVLIGVSYIFPAYQMWLLIAALILAVISVGLFTAVSVELRNTGSRTSYISAVSGSVLSSISLLGVGILLALPYLPSFSRGSAAPASAQLAVPVSDYPSPQLRSSYSDPNDAFDQLNRLQSI